ncbi:hypothetical protein ACNKHU_17380 [Shigella flexneri]
MTRVHSRWVRIPWGIILILFGMVPKWRCWSPPCAICAGRRWLVMFGTAAGDTGISYSLRCTTPPTVTTSTSWRSSLGVGIILPNALSRFLLQLLAVLQPLLHSGIMLATLSAVVLNVFFNGYQHHADLVKESVSDKDLVSQDSTYVASDAQAEEK